MNKLTNYGQRISKKIEEKNRILKSTKILFAVRDDIIDLFEKGTFPYKGNVFKTKKEESKEESKKERNKKFFKYIEDELKDVNYDLFKECFHFEVPTVLAKKYEIKDKKKNNNLVEPIKIRWSNLKDEMEKMCKKEIENEKPDNILEIVEEILKFNRAKQLGQGLKILTPNQMLSRLPIALAQLKAGNNSEKLKN